jgi:osmoprotectant transport system substrate-binding protein
MKRVLILLAFLVSVLGCRAKPSAGGPLVVASANTPEQLVIGKITVQALRAAGYEVIDKTGLGEPWAVRAALKAGSVDICWEYTGDTWLFYLGHDQPISDPEECYERVRTRDALNNITWLKPAPAQHTMALVMRQDVAREMRIATVSDLARRLNHVDPYVRLCVPEPLSNAVSGIRGLERVYSMRFNAEYVSFLSMPEGYKALQANQCDCALGYSSDGELEAYKLVALRDDRGFFHASNLAPVVRTPVLQRYPDLEVLLSEQSQRLDQTTLTSLRQQVILDGRKPETVARRFLGDTGLLGILKGALLRDRGG